MFSVKLCLNLEEGDIADGDVTQPDLGFVVQEGARKGVRVEWMRDDPPLAARQKEVPISAAMHTYVDHSKGIQYNE